MTKKINWLNTSFLTIVPLIALIGTPLLLIYSHVSWLTWGLALIYTILVGFSVTGGYHRLFAHLSYKAVWPVRLFFALFGAAAFEGSILEWSTDHRAHHRYTDSEKDPYNIKEGFWHAHIGWLLTLDQDKRDFANVEDLKADSIVRWQHRWYVLISMVMSFVIPTVLAALWGNALAGFVIAGALRITFNHHTTFFINSICHMFGKRTYSDQQSARDNWVTALLTFGEGYHNFHHQFPIDYRNGVRYFHFDPTKWLIRLLSFLGMASDLRRISEHKILQYRMRNEENRLQQHLQHHASSMRDYILAKMLPVKESIHEILSTIDALEQEYVALKNARIDGVKVKVREYRRNLAAQREQLRRARYELKQQLAHWSMLMRHGAKLVPVKSS